LSTPFNIRCQSLTDMFCDMLYVDSQYVYDGVAKELFRFVIVLDTAETRQ